MTLPDWFWLLVFIPLGALAAAALFSEPWLGWAASRLLARRDALREYRKRHQEAVKRWEQQIGVERRAEVREIRAAAGEESA